MPYVDLFSEDDYASIWYRTNSPFGNVGSLDPEKPCVIILHPMLLDTTWLDNQFGDPRLDTGFNLVAFDMRVCGKSSCRPSGLHDSWVEAADLALVHQALHLPPSHIMAQENISIHCALRFACLFPEMCLSLTLCNVPPPTELKWTFNAYDELLQAWCYTEDLDSLEHAGMEVATLVIGRDGDADLIDDLITYWEVEMPPFRRKRTLTQINTLMNRTPLQPEIAASIYLPVLIIQSERYETCPLKYAEKLAADLVNAQGGAILYTVKGATGCLSIVPSNASITNQVFAKFISRLPRARSDILAPACPKRERMANALKRLAELVQDPSMAQRDPCSSLSFSCLSPDVAKNQLDSLKFYGKGQHNAFSPLGPDGRPVRKFSERKEDHWFHGELDGSSYAGPLSTSVRRAPKRGKHQPGRQDQASMDSSTETISAEAVLDSSLQRATFSPQSVEKEIIKGSMAKVVGSTTVYPLQRLF